MSTTRTKRPERSTVPRRSITGAAASPVGEIHTERSEKNFTIASSMR
jgi:hypothetical protein